MESANTPPRHLVVMGVSGSGKSTIGRAIAERLDATFAEGDDFHPQANLDAMTRGESLGDEDRWPWLASLARWVTEQDAAEAHTVMSCSALRRSYRDVLRRSGATFFVHLVGDEGVLRERMQAREHFMPPGLLESQLQILEPLADDEPGMVLDVVNTPQWIVAAVAHRVSRL